MLGAPTVGLRWAGFDMGWGYLADIFYQTQIPRKPITMRVFKGFSRNICFT
jgi:hypothetical protein